jgi:hypothetical protein
MNNETKNITAVLNIFNAPKKWLLLIILAVLAGAALIEFFALGLARRTFIFYAVNGKTVTVEDRMLRVFRGKKVGSSPREVNITRYVEEALLGPVSPDTLPLFPKETRLLSLLYRDGVVYVDFSEDAALPPREGGEVLANMEVLYSGVKRNFPYVRDIRFFIAGKAVYTGHFRNFASSGRVRQESRNFMGKSEI